MSCSPGQELIGDVPIVTATFRDDENALANPATVTVKVRQPNGTTLTYTSPDASITNPSTGVWKFTLPFAYNQAGEWAFYVVGAGGDAQAASQLKKKVRAPEMALT